MKGPVGVTDNDWFASLSRQPFDKCKSRKDRTLRIGRAFDTSLIEADASNSSVVDTQSLKRYVKRGYRELETRLDDLQVQKTTPANSRFMSTTDPDASVTRQGSVKSKLRYKTHRSVDPKYELIIPTKVTPGSQDDGELLKEMIDIHQSNTQKTVDTVVADSTYGTIDNYLICHDQGIKCHIPSLEETYRGSGRQKGIFPKEAFTSHPDTDTFSCPAGHLLKRRSYYTKRNHYEYKAPPELCTNCQLREECTRSKDGRTLKRHVRQDQLDIMREHATSTEAKRDIKTRQHLSERSFGQSTRYGYKRARWRRLWKVQIQDFPIAALQNIMVLIKRSKDKLAKGNAQAGQVIMNQKPVWNTFPFVSSLTRLVGQFTMALRCWREFFSLRRNLTSIVRY
jgi:hypothetical protein